MHALFPLDPSFFGRQSELSEGTLDSTTAGKNSYIIADNETLEGSSNKKKRLVVDESKKEFNFNLHLQQPHYKLYGFYPLSWASDPVLFCAFCSLIFPSLHALHSPLPCRSFLNYSAGSLSSQGSRRRKNRPRRSTENLILGNQNGIFSIPVCLF